jgi:hypothetical protein
MRGLIHEKGVGEVNLSRRIGRRRFLGVGLAIFEEVLWEEAAEFGDFGRGFIEGIERDCEKRSLAFDF